MDKKVERWAKHWAKTLEIVGEILTEIQSITNEHLAKAETPAQFAQVIHEAYELMSPISSIGAIIQQNHLDEPDDDDDDTQPVSKQNPFSKN
jgi:hypothetical protein